VVTMQRGAPTCGTIFSIKGLQRGRANPTSMLGCLAAPIGPDEISRRIRPIYDRMLH
jgi:hypothetical protein